MQTWKVKKKTPVRNSSTHWGTRLFSIIFLIATLGLFVFDFPAVWNQAVTSVGIESVKAKETPFRLGLDLQGGTHLAYEADMSQIFEEDREQALEGVRDVIERRVNAFGVSEPVVQTTTTGGTHRIIVELAGVLDVNEAINQIGETPVLEFKIAGQQKGRDLTPDEQFQLEDLQAEQRQTAQSVLRRAQNGEQFDALMDEFSIELKSDTRGQLNGLSENTGYSQVVTAIENRRLGVGRIYPEVFETSDGLNVFRLESKQDKTEFDLAHILICFEGKISCNNPIPEIEASIKINELKELATPENFADLARENSTGPSGPDGGNLGWSDASGFVDGFRLAATALELGRISNVVETDFGYHLIHKREQRTVPSYDITRILMSLADEFDIVPPSSPWVNTELSGKHLDHASVQFDANTGAPNVALSFDGQGGDLFGDMTATHVGEPIAIFLDGSPISTPVVQSAIYGGQAIITGDFTTEEAKLLAQRLNAGALPVPVNLLSQQTIGPTLGAVSLQKSITAALVGFALVALFMIVVYRLPGLIAVVALMMFTALNLAAYRLFGVTITLAGIAGFVLSLGIAVDANVLIIERLKEERQAGRGYLSAIDEAFSRAWAAIRDGNLTTLIAAAVLYWFSSSFIRGFALTLSIGVLLSMFTAITITRVYLKTVLAFHAARKDWLFGVRGSR